LSEIVDALKSLLIIMKSMGSILMMLSALRKSLG
jgi:hypothetical protein